VDDGPGWQLREEIGGLLGHGVVGVGAGDDLLGRGCLDEERHSFLSRFHERQGGIKHGFVDEFRVLGKPEDGLEDAAVQHDNIEGSPYLAVIVAKQLVAVAQGEDVPARAVNRPCPSSNTASPATSLTEASLSPR